MREGERTRKIERDIVVSLHVLYVIMSSMLMKENACTLVCCNLVIFEIHRVYDIMAMS